MSPLIIRTLVTLLASSSSKKYDPIMDWIPPPLQDIKETRQSIIEPMQSLTSSVFFSTDAKTGKRFAGLDQLVNVNAGDRPILFVSNHQLAGFDSLLVVAELWKIGIQVRALTHPFLSSKEDADVFTLPGSQFYQTYGCLPVSPRTFYKLMKTNQPTLLFPGGAKESFHKSNEQYTLKGWATTAATDGASDFVRTAAKFNATIIPFSSVGAAESAFFLDPLPFSDLVGDVLLRATGTQGGAPYNARYDAKRESINFPLVLPKPLPARHYYLFDQPIDLTHVDYKNRQECSQIYQTIKTTIQTGCNDLLRASKQDPFGPDNTLQRVTYEQLWKKQAPTFNANLLN